MFVLFKKFGETNITILWFLKAFKTFFRKRLNLFHFNSVIVLYLKLIHMITKFFRLLFLTFAIVSCNKTEMSDYQETTTEIYPNVLATFGSNINLNNLENYANQPIPSYITKDNTGSNFITDKGATLGRVLFYDKNLSSNNSISCASCHQQENAFSDTNIASTGVNGKTDRHSMRLVNNRFSREMKFFGMKELQV